MKRSSMTRNLAKRTLKKTTGQKKTLTERERRYRHELYGIKSNANVVSRNQVFY